MWGMPPKCRSAAIDPAYGATLVSSVVELMGVARARQIVTRSGRFYPWPFQASDTVFCGFASPISII